MIERRSFLAGAAGTLFAGAIRAESKPSQVGCQANAWKIDAASFPELLSRVSDLARLGFEAFECNVRFVEGQFGNAAEARDRIAGTGVRYYGPHTGLKWPLDQLRKYADGAASLGARHVAISAVGRVPAPDGKLDQSALGQKVETLNRFGEHCRKNGLRLAFHNHIPEFESDGREMEELLRRTDPRNVFLLLDIGHAANAHADVPAFFAKHHRRVDALHLRDVKDGKQVPMGQGEFDFKALAAALRTSGWTGWLTLEEESLHSTDNRYIDSVLASGRKLIHQYFGA